MTGSGGTWTNPRASRSHLARPRVAPAGGGLPLGNALIFRLRPTPRCEWRPYADAWEIPGRRSGELRFEISIAMPIPIADGPLKTVPLADLLGSVGVSKSSVIRVTGPGSLSA